MLLTTVFLTAYLALSSAFPWTYVGDDFHTAERAQLAQVTSSSCIGLPSPISALGGGTENLHICSFVGQEDVCAVPTSLRPCCSGPAVSGQMARALTFDRFNDSGSDGSQTHTHSVRYYEVDVGACYFIEPALSRCFNCPSTTCAAVPNPFCVEGVNAETCTDGACQCKRGFEGEFCCDCLTEGFFRPIGTQNCSPCGCCSDNVLGRSSLCDVDGICGDCNAGFYGKTCCESCGCCTEGTVGQADECDVNGRCTCALGFSGDKCCTNDCNCCTDGTVGRSNECDASGCTCLEQYTGEGCCDLLQCDELPDPANGLVTVTGRVVGSTATYSCDNGFELTGAASRSCAVVDPSTTVSWTNDEPVCTSLITCGERTDMYFILDTTIGIQLHELCLQTYSVMEIIAALQIGTDPQQSLVETILYPAPRVDEDDAPASYLFQLGMSPCQSIINELEDLEEDIFNSVFHSSSYQPEYQTRGERNLPQRAIELLGTTLSSRSTQNRRRIGILLTNGVQSQLPNITLEEVRAALPDDLDMIAAGYIDEEADIEVRVNRTALEQDLLTIAKVPANVILETSIPAVARSLVEKLQQKNVICDSEAEDIIRRISTNSFTQAQEYCRCLQNRINPVRSRCDNPPSTPSCSRMASMMDFNQFFEFASREETLTEEVKSEIMSAVRDVLEHNG